MGLLKDYFETLHRDTKGRLKRVLVVVDSSPASEALVDMLEAYFPKDDEREELLDTRPDLHILDTTTTDESIFRERDFKWMRYTKLDVSSLQQSRIGLSFTSGRILKSTLEERFREDILTAFTTDSRGEALSILLSKIIATYAGDGGYDVVLHGDTATRIASKVLTLTSQGRGFTVPWECGTLVKMPNSTYSGSSPLTTGVYSARPLKDLSDTEIIAYLEILHDKPLSASNEHSSSTPTDNTSPAASIDEMMINYISGLETSFPSIVATTGRTADKLDLPVTEVSSTCLVCSMPKRSDSAKSWLDNITVTHPAPDLDGGENRVTGESGKGGNDVTDEICYGCYTLFRSSRGVVHWPI